MDRNEQSLFFYILRRALWGEGESMDSSVFGNLNPAMWKKVLDALEAHGLLAFAADAVMKLNDHLPLEKQLEPQMIFELLQYSANCTQSHFLLNNEVVKVFKRLESAGYHPVLLKGQGLDTLYPIPNTRSCGDIDIYMPNDEYIEACHIVDEICDIPYRKIDFDPNTIHHSAEKGSIEYEIHYLAADTAIPSIKKNYNVWASKWLCENSPEDVKCNDSVMILGEKIRVPNTYFNMIYVFEHLLKHLRYEGVGFRQFVDWILLIKQYNAKCKNDGRLQKHLERFHLLDAWQVLGGIVVYQLGFPKDQYPLWNEKKSRYSQGRNLQYFVDSEDLGHGTAQSKGYYYMPPSLMRKWLALKYYFRYTLFEYRVFPYDTLGHFVKRFSNKV